MSAASVGDVVTLYEQFGADPLIAAALLHDVGHLLELQAAGAPSGRGRVRATGDLGHEATGAQYLAALFPPSVTAPVALHVRAKRYLCAADPGYEGQLSDGSKHSLALQGGPLDAAAMQTFRDHPEFEAAVLLRVWDDRGKIDHLDVAPLESYRNLLERVAAG